MTVKAKLMIVRPLLVLVLALRLFEVPHALAQNLGKDHIDRIFRGLRPPVAIKNRPPVRWTLAERMAALRVPGISIAIIDKGKVIWARAFGIKERGTTDPVTTSTLFQAQSISKPVAATAMLRLVEAGE